MSGQRTSIIDKISLGKYLAEKRMKAGVTQIELQKKLGYTSPQYISNWERGICAPPIHQLYDICKITKADRQELFDFLMTDLRNFLEKDLRLNPAKAPRQRRLPEAGL
jgi:transcriptional regulator with XRE-family HTH domain